MTSRLLIIVIFCALTSKAIPTVTLFADSNVVVNASVSAPGTYNAMINRNIAMNTLVVGGTGSTPIINIGTGINLNLNQLSFLGGVINIGTAAKLTVQTITANASPVIINIGAGSTFSVGAIDIYANSSTSGNLLTINGDGLLSLNGITINVAGSNLAINTPVVIRATTVISTTGNAAVNFGSLVSVVSSVNLNANIIANNKSNIVLSQVPEVTLGVVNAQFMIGSTLTIGLNGNSSNVLNVSGTLTSKAILLLNGPPFAKYATYTPIIYFGAISGGFDVSRNIGGLFSVGATKNFYQVTKA